MKAVAILTKDLEKMSNILPFDWKSCVAKMSGDICIFDIDSDCFEKIRQIMPEASRLIRQQENQEKLARQQNINKTTKSNIAPKLLPGSLVEIVLNQMGYVKTNGCGCNKMKNWMNRLGWWGCWKRRDEIIDWFYKKAQETNISIDQKSIYGLFKAAIKDKIKKDKNPD